MFSEASNRTNTASAGVSCRPKVVFASGSPVDGGRLVGVAKSGNAARSKFPRSRNHSGLMPCRMYCGGLVSSGTGTHATSVPPSMMRAMPSPVTSPITSELSSQRSNSAWTFCSHPRFAMTSMRSCDSESMTSYAVIPSSRRGTRDTSIRRPVPDFEAHSIAALVSPAAPRSCNPTIQSVCTSSRQASISSFSMNGLPTCTAGRRSSDCSFNSTLAKVAPWIPSRPVSAPTRIRGLPGPSARAFTSSPTRAIPTHIAFTSGLPLYDEENPVSPPTVGSPIQLPYQPMPATISLNRCRLCAASSTSAGVSEAGWSGPKRSESSMAIGRAPIAKMSRIMPPTPVAAPCSGSIADGWLCDSTFIATSQPSPISTAPAFSSPALVSTRLPSVGKRRNSGRLFL